MQLQKKILRTTEIIVAFLIFATLNACNITTTSKESNEDRIVVSEKPETKTTDTPSAIAPTSPTENNSLITCNSVGPINLSDDYNKIIQISGKENITIDSNYTEGEFTGVYTTLWKGTPKEIKIYWDETSVSNKKVGSIEIENEKSIYHFSNGVKIGSTLDQLIKMNDNKPLRFYGFDWDYGGMLINDGIGIGSYKCFSGTLNYSGNSIDKKFLGDKEMNSSMPGIPLKKIYLSSIQIHSPQ